MKRLFHRHKADRIVRVWHGENIFGNPGTFITYVCRDCGDLYTKQVWGHYELADLVADERGNDG